MQGDPAPLIFDAPLLLVGGGPVSAPLLDEAEALARHRVAADGGADRLAALRGPDAVEAAIGDMDSLASRADWAARLGPRFLHVAEQDSTDLQKCLRLTRAPLTVGVGFLDGRLDHTLAALSALCGAAGRAILLIGEEDCAALLPPRWRVDIAPGARVSFFPMGPVRIGRSTGLEWPADGLAFTPAGRIGTSNRAAAAEVTLDIASGPLVALLPRDAAPALARSLAPGLTSSPIGA